MFPIEDLLAFLSHCWYCDTCLYSTWQPSFVPFPACVLIVLCVGSIQRHNIPMCTELVLSRLQLLCLCCWSAGSFGEIQAYSWPSSLFGLCGPSIGGCLTYPLLGTLQWSLLPVDALSVNNCSKRDAFFLWLAAHYICPGEKPSPRLSLIELGSVSHAGVVDSIACYWSSCR